MITSTWTRNAKCSICKNKFICGNEKSGRYNNIIFKKDLVCDVWKLQEWDKLYEWGYTGYQPTDKLDTSNPPNNADVATKELLQDIISWEKNLSEYDSLESILNKKYRILKR